MIYSPLLFGGRYINSDYIIHHPMRFGSLGVKVLKFIHIAVYESGIG